MKKLISKLAIITILCTNLLLFNITNIQASNSNINFNNHAINNGEIVPFWSPEVHWAYRILDKATYYVKWISRDEGVSLSISPKHTYDWTSSKTTWDVWNAILIIHQDDERWNNTSIMKQQYDCHIGYGFIKTPWNIEPWKTKINRWTCN